LDSTTPREERGPRQGEQHVASGVRCGRSVATAPQALDVELAQLAGAGYVAAELEIDTLQCIFAGRLVERAVAVVAAICARHPSLAYSVHSPAVLDLRDRQYPDLQREILLGSVRFAAAIGARVLVVHYEARSDDPRVEEQYRAAIMEAAELAGRHALILGIENIEVERSERVLEFLEQVRHPWVRMTYDFGHNYLAGNHFGYDHVAAARACAPYVAHLHITDNFGRFNPARLGDFNLYRAIPHSNVAIMGLGDLHLPLGWGSLPARRVYEHFAAHGYSGLLISEHDRGVYASADDEVCHTLRALTARSGATP
jgi:sugar phosphate isomerase/epimerase